MPTKWTNITGTGLGGTYSAIELDPFSDFLGVMQSGALGAWVLSSTGLYYTPNILATNPIWTLKNNLLSYSPSVSDGRLRPSRTDQGVIYVAWVNDNGSNASKVYTARLSAYGATLDWTNALATSGAQGNGDMTVGMDIDSYGSDEMLVSARENSQNKASVWRILNGSPTRLTNTGIDNPPNGSAIAFIQKPLLTFAGGTNNGTGSTENFIYSGYDGNSVPKLMKTTDGGASNTNCAPGSPFTYVPSTVRSITPVDDPNYLAVVDISGGLWTSVNAGGSWVNRGGSPSLCSGLFPRLINGQRALYMASVNNLYYSPDGGATQLVKTGSWVTDIGAITSFRGVLPLY
jgi:hypothetical protein